jgi:hypothetical protein
MLHNFEKILHDSHIPLNKIAANKKSIVRQLADDALFFILKTEPKSVTFQECQSFNLNLLFSGSFI